MRRALESRVFLSALLAMGTGVCLYYLRPFPADQVFLRVIALRAPDAFRSFKGLYDTMLFTTPFLAYSAVLSGLYIFTLRPRAPLPAGHLPAYPDPKTRTDLFLIVGEVHNPRKPVPAEAPSWLTIPERGLFTGVAILGAIGSGKTSCCMLPFAEQILAFQASDQDKRIGGLILEVKGDFCRRVKQILERHGRSEDYVEISLDSEYCYNPLHNELDAYALAYNIASLLNNLFGRGKEPFWQQAYTNLVKFIILLHKVAYDYVTFFDVYQCAISPPLLEERVAEAEDIILGRHYVALTPHVYGERVADLAGLGFQHDQKEDRFLAPRTAELREHLKARAIPFESRTILDPSQADPEKLAQLEAVKRWLYDDWKRIEPKLRTSIVEGVSVFLSLFDDNLKVKRVFCPRKECYDAGQNVANRFGKPLPSFSWLIEHGAVCALNFPIGMNAGLAKALGVMMKLDFERAVLNRVPKMEAHPEQYFRQVLFLCDEYQHFATVGEAIRLEMRNSSVFRASQNAFPSSRPKASARSGRLFRARAGAPCFRRFVPRFSCRCPTISPPTASDLCGREDQLKVSYSLSESGQDSKVSWLSGKALSHKANLVASKSYNTHSDYRFDMKTFMELRKRPVRRDCLRRDQPHPPDVLLPQAALQRPERFVFRPARERKTLMNGFE